MKKLKFHILFISFVLLAIRGRSQQTIQFSQYMFNGLALNPAYAGYKDDWTVNLSSRIQWVGIADAPKTGAASVDGLINSTNKNIGVGLIATFDQLGPETTSSVYANYAYRLRLDALDTKRLCFGLAFGVVQYRLDGSKLNAADAGDSEIPPTIQSNLTPDFRFGIYYYSPQFYLGASVFNLLSGTAGKLIDNIQVVKQVRTAYITAGAMLPLSEFIDIKPSLMIKEDFKAPTNMDIGASIVLNKRVWLGASYRTGIDVWNKSNLQTGLDKSDALAIIAQFYASPQFRIGYSFDFATSKLANEQQGSHELSVSIGFPGKKQRVMSPRYF